MTPTETRKLVDLAYAQWPHMEPDDNLYTLWHLYLGEYPVEIVSPALKAVLRYAIDHPPKFGHILDEIENPRLRRRKPVEHPPDCHCADLSHGRLFHSRAGIMTCPGPLEPEALEAYVSEWLAKDEAERRQQPHIKALPRPQDAITPDYRAALQIVRPVDE